MHYKYNNDDGGGGGGFRVSIPCVFSAVFERVISFAHAAIQINSGYESA